MTNLRCKIATSVGTVILMLKMMLHQLIINSRYSMMMTDDNDVEDDDWLMLIKFLLRWYMTGIYLFMMLMMTMIKY